MKRKAVDAPSANAADNPALGRCECCKILVFRKDIRDGYTLLMNQCSLSCAPVFQCPPEHKDDCQNIALLNEGTKQQCTNCWAVFFQSDLGEGGVDPVVAFRKPDGTVKCASADACNLRQLAVLCGTGSSKRSRGASLQRNPPPSTEATAVWDKILVGDLWETTNAETEAERNMAAEAAALAEQAGGMSVMQVDGAAENVVEEEEEEEATAANVAEEEEEEEEEEKDDEKVADEAAAAKAAAEAGGTSVMQVDGAPANVEAAAAAAEEAAAAKAAAEAGAAKVAEEEEEEDEKEKDDEKELAANVAEAAKAITLESHLKTTSDRKVMENADRALAKDGMTRAMDVGVRVNKALLSGAEATEVEDDDDDEEEEEDGWRMDGCNLGNIGVRFKRVGQRHVGVRYNKALLSGAEAKVADEKAAAKAAEEAAAAKVAEEVAAAAAEVVAQEAAAAKVAEEAAAAAAKVAQEAAAAKYPAEEYPVRALDFGQEEAAEVKAAETGEKEQTTKVAAEAAAAKVAEETSSKGTVEEAAEESETEDEDEFWAARNGERETVDPIIKEEMMDEGGPSQAKIVAFASFAKARSAADALAILPLAVPPRALTSNIKAGVSSGHVFDSFNVALRNSAFLVEHLLPYCGSFSREVNPNFHFRATESAKETADSYWLQVDHGLATQPGAMKAAGFGYITNSISETNAQSGKQTLNSMPKALLVLSPWAELISHHTFTFQPIVVPALNRNDASAKVPTYGKTVLGDFDTVSMKGYPDTPFLVVAWVTIRCVGDDKQNAEARLTWASALAHHSHLLHTPVAIIGDLKGNMYYALGHDFNPFGDEKNKYTRSDRAELIKVWKNPYSANRLRLQSLFGLDPAMQPVADLKALPTQWQPAVIQSENPLNLFKTPAATASTALVLPPTHPPNGEILDVDEIMSVFSQSMESLPKAFEDYRNWAEEKADASKGARNALPPHAILTKHAINVGRIATTALNKIVKNLEKVLSIAPTLRDMRQKLEDTYRLHHDDMLVVFATAKWFQTKVYDPEKVNSVALTHLTVLYDKLILSIDQRAVELTPKLMPPPLPVNNDVKMNDAIVAQAKAELAAAQARSELAKVEAAKRSELAAAQARSELAKLEAAQAKAELAKKDDAQKAEKEAAVKTEKERAAVVAAEKEAAVAAVTAAHNVREAELKGQLDALKQQVSHEQSSSDLKAKLAAVQQEVADQKEHASLWFNSLLDTGELRERKRNDTISEARLAAEEAEKRKAANDAGELNKLLLGHALNPKPAQHGYPTYQAPYQPPYQPPYQQQQPYQPPYQPPQPPYQLPYQPPYQPPYPYPHPQHLPHPQLNGPPWQYPPHPQHAPHPQLHEPEPHRQSLQLQLQGPPDYSHPSDYYHLPRNTYQPYQPPVHLPVGPPPYPHMPTGQPPVQPPVGLPLYPHMPTGQPPVQPPAGPPPYPHMPFGQPPVLPPAGPPHYPYPPVGVPVGLPPSLHEVDD